MKKIQLRLIKDNSTDIIINKGIASQLKSVLPRNTDFFILTDQNIYNYYGELLKEQFQDYKYNIMLCPNGEDAKDFDYIRKIYSDLIEYKLILFHLNSLMSDWQIIIGLNYFLTLQINLYPRLSYI